MSGSIAFDQAAEYYDRTRALPAEVTARQAELLSDELRHAERVLEIGVGTGRIAVTLDAPVVGLDLSRPMMKVLRSKSRAIPLVEGDATRLPFADDAFDAAYAAHVFHLIPPWEDAFAELVRVVRPGGIVLAVRGSGRSDVGWELNEVVAVRRSAVGADTIEEIDDAARRSGLGVRTLPELRWSAGFDLGAEIAGIEERAWSGLWHLADEEVRDATARARTWAIERFGSADAVVPAMSSFCWHAYDVPS